MKAIILAGGYGTRLYPLTLRTPKPLLPVSGKPVIVHTIESLAAAGITEIVVSMNSSQKKMMDCIGDGKKFGARIEYVVEPGKGEEAKLGAVGGLKYVFSRIGTPDECLVLGGDNFIHGLDFSKLRGFHSEKRAHATLVLYELEDEREAEKFGIAKVDSRGMITGFREKPKPSESAGRLASTAIYHFGSRFLENLPRFLEHKRRMGEKPDKLGELFEHFVGELDIAGYAYRGHWGDIGSPESYLETNRHAMRLLKMGTDVRDKAKVDASAKLLRPIIIEEGVTVGAGAVIGPYSQVMHRSKVGEGARVRESIIFEDVEIGSGCKVDGAVVDGSCKVGEKAEIGKGSVIGFGCVLGSSARIAPGSRLFPFQKVAKGNSVSGVLGAPPAPGNGQLAASCYWK